MKKLKIFSIVLFLISTILFVAFKTFNSIRADKTPPVVTCKEETRMVTTAITEEELLRDVSAEDKKSGDVSDTLVIESMSPFTDENKRIVTYAAVDASKNVGRCEQTIIYEDYEKPQFGMTGALCFPVGSRVNILGKVTAHSALDGDLTEKIKYSLEDTINTIVEGSYPIEFRVMDSGGNTVYLDTQVEIYDTTLSGIEVELTEYLAYIKEGSHFNAHNYYKGANVEGTLSVKSSVDTNVPGTYFVDYIVKTERGSGKTRLTVIVEGDER